MKWSIRIARIAGTDVKIHLTFVILLAWIGLSYYLRGGSRAAIEGVLFIILLFACVLLHEFGHSLAARSFGIQTPDITLLPIGGIARLQRMPDKPAQELVVALAGPAVNVIIALVLMVFLGQGADLSSLETLEHPGVAMLAKLASVNIGLVLFNLIPAFPMDGGRVLRAVLALGMNYARATRIAATVGQALAFVFGFIGLFYNPLLVFIALFIYLGASQEAAAVQFRDLTNDMPVSEAMITEFVSLAPGDTMEQAVEALLRTSQHEFPVIDHEQQVLGVLTRDDMLAAVRRTGMSTPVNAVMHRGIPTIRSDAPFNEAFRLMQECQCPALPVIDLARRLVGLITPENIGEMMMIKSILPDGSLPSWRASRT